MVKRLSNVGRRTINTLINAIPKGKPAVDLHLIMKRGKILAQAVGDLMVRHHYYATLTCRSTDVHLPVELRRKEYEFSCSSTPVVLFPFHVRKSKRRYSDHDGDGSNHLHIVGRTSQAPLVEEEDAVVVEEMGVGNSTVSLRRVEDEGGCVDWAAEVFIKRFYEELRLQNTTGNHVEEMDNFNG
ncbi:hypothetical protein Ancab_002081 [Ancistrocladus abbreviatus]